MFLDMLIFAVMAMYYKYVVITDESEGNGNGIPMNGKHGSINATFVEDNEPVKR